MILYIVSESDQSLVVQAETGVVVIEDKDPFPLLMEIGKEHVLRPLVYHAEQFGDKVVGDQVINIEMIPNLVLEFIQVILGGYDPRGNGHELLRLAGARLVLGVDSVIVRIAGLEVVHPVRPGEIGGLEEATIGGIVRELPALVTLGETEGVGGGLVVIEIIFTHELQRIICRLTVEDGYRVAVYRCADLLVCLLGRGGKPHLDQ